MADKKTSMAGEHKSEFWMKRFDRKIGELTLDPTYKVHVPQGESGSSLEYVVTGFSDSDPKSTAEEQVQDVLHSLNCDAKGFTLELLEQDAVREIIDNARAEYLAGDTLAQPLAIGKGMVLLSRKEIEV